MRKTLTYTTFGVASLLVIMLFVTARSYNQLTLGVFLYVPLAYLALTIFPRKKLKSR